MSDIEKNDPPLMEEDEALLDAELDDLNDDLLDDDFDEDWDDVDEEDAITSESSTINTEKSFVANNFNFIVIGVAAVFGGLFILSTLNGQSKSQKNNNMTAQSTTAVKETNAEITQAPSKPLNIDLDSLRKFDKNEIAVLPYQREIEQLDTKAQSGQNTSHTNSGDDLNAMLDSLAPEDDFFNDLESELAADQNDSLTPNNTPQLETNLPSEKSPPEDKSPLLPMPKVTEDTLDNFKTDMGPSEIQFSKQNAPQNDAPVKKSSLKINLNPTSIGATVDTSVETAKSSPPLSNTQTAMLKKEVITLNTRLESALNKNITLENELSQNNINTKTLEQKVQSLETKVIDLKKEKELLLTQTKSDPKTQYTSKSPSSTKEIIKTPSKPNLRTKKKQAPRWVVRSAQEGRAILSNTKTGDLLKISVGDKIAGLGTIRSINLTNGHWTIVGSTASINR